MGKGTDSFKREIGKNTGKWVSNKIFGDGHSTPHRVSVRVQKEKIKSDLRKEELKFENKKRKAEFRKELISKGKQFLSENDEGLNQEIQSFTEKKDQIVSTIIPDNLNDIQNLTNYLISEIKANGWKSSEKEKHISLLSDVCLTKLEQCVIKLKTINAISEANYIESEIKKIKKSKFKQKYLFFIGAGLFIIIFFVLYQLGYLK